MKSKTMAVCKEVIICTEIIGEGREADPCRELTVVREKDGTFIAEHDSWNGEEY